MASIGPKEQARVHLYHSELVFSCESAFTLWQQGALDEATYRTREDFIASVIIQPGITEWWAA